MRLAGLGLILAAAIVALGELWISRAAVPADSFTGPAITYAIAGIMLAGGLSALLFDGGPHPVDEEPENLLLHLVG